MFSTRSLKILRIGLLLNIFVLLFSAIISFCAPDFGSIQHANAAKVEVGVPVPGTSGTSYDFKGYVKAIYTFAIRIATPLVILMIIYAGYIYLFSQGDTTKVNQAKDILSGAILGYLLLLVIGVILTFIGITDLGIKPGTK